MEKWIAQRHQERVLAGETTPAGSCPDESFLYDLARRSKRIPLNDPRVEHAATCPRCMGRLLAVRQETRPRSRRRLVFAAAVVSCVAVAAVVLSIAKYQGNRRPATESAEVVSRTVNLWDAGTVRGEPPGASQPISLPAAKVRVTIILPRFSPSGEYMVAVTRDQNGNGMIAQGGASTVSNGSQESVTVDLDLRRANPGDYFLATIQRQDQATYYYPAQIK